MGKLDTKIQRQGSHIQLSLGGTIDEDADFSLLDIRGGVEVAIDLSGIKSINSCGIREWIKWIASAGSAQVIYTKCPKVIVDQINMVDGFLPAKAKVASFYVPYFNEESGFEKNVLFRYGAEYKEGVLTPPKGVVDEEGNPMEMDVLEAKYFRFIKKHV